MYMTLSLLVSLFQFFCCCCSFGVLLLLEIYFQCFQGFVFVSFSQGGG